ncbi:hypothetical protein ScPMuIL_015977 [Solemya velum]
MIEQEQVEYSEGCLYYKKYNTRHIPGRTIDTIQEEQLLPCIESGQEVTPHQMRLIRECVEGGNDVYFQFGQTNTITRDIIMFKDDTELRKLKDKKIYVYDSNDVEKSYLSEKSWKISKQDVHEIVEIETSLGFPQCCRDFVSDQACFDKSVEFFKRPLKAIGDILYEMSRSSDKDVQHDYCVLGCVLIFGGFSEEYIRKIDDSKSDICFKVSDIAKACGLDSVLSRNISLSSERLSTSYLAFRNGKYLFRHDSMLESVFSSFFKLRIELLIACCEWELLERLISTENEDEKDGFCILHQNHYGKFIDRLLEELTENSRGYSGTVKSLLSHRVFNNTKFVKSFFQNLSVSQKSTILEIRHGYILEQLGDCPSVEFVVRLVSELQSEWRADDIERGLRQALYRACVVDNYNVYKYLTTKHSLIPDATCLFESCSRCSIKVLSDMLERYEHWSPKYHIHEALNKTCLLGFFNIYKDLMAYIDEHEIACIAGIDLLQYAVKGARCEIVSDLLQRYKKLFLASHLQVALIAACRSKFLPAVDVYKCLMAYVDEQEIEGIAGVDLLQCAVQGAHSGIVSELLRRYKDSFLVSHIQEALIGTCRAPKTTSVDVYKCLMAYVDEHKIKGITGVDLLQYATECGGSGIVSDLLRRYKDSFLVSHIQEALIGACRSGYESSVDVYKCLMAYVDEHQIKDIAGVDLLQHAAESGGSGKVSDLLRRYKDSFLVSHIQEALIGACRSGYESSVDVYKCLMAYVDENQIKDITGVDLLQYAVQGGGGSGIVFDLLRRYKDSFLVSHIQEALIGACRSGYKSSVDVYKCLMAYVDENQIKGIAGVDLLQYAVQGAHSEIVSDLLQRYEKLFLASHLQVALIAACRSKFLPAVDVYKCLMAYVDEHEIAGIAGIDLLQYAVKGARCEIVSDLLQRYKKLFLASHLQVALIAACRSKFLPAVDVYKCLMAYVDEQEIEGIAGVDLLQCAVQGAHSGIVSELLRRYKDSFLVSHIQEALIGTCRAPKTTSVDVYKCLMAYVDEHQIKDIAGVDLLQYAAEGGGGSGKVSDLLRRYKDSFLAFHIQEALIGACRSRYESSVDIYKCLMAYVDDHQIKGITGVDLLQYAAEGGCESGIVSDLLRRYKDSFLVSHIQEALIGTCRAPKTTSVDVYKCLMANVDEHKIEGITGVDLLQYAAEGGGGSGKVSDLLRRYKDSFKVSHIQEALIGACRSKCKFSVDVYKCLMAYVDEHQIKDIAGVDLLQYAAEGGGGSGIVSDLLRRYKDSFLVSHIQEALIRACRSGYESSVDIYKCLMAYVDEHQIKDIAGVDLLQYAAEGGGGSGIVSDLLRRYKDSFLVSHIREALIGACRSGYVTSVDIYKCLMTYVDEHQIKDIAGVDLLQYAAEGGCESGIVSDLLRRYKDSFLVSHIQEALIGTCRAPKTTSVDVYKCLMANVDEHKIKGITGVDLLQYAAEGGGSGIVSDLLRHYKESFLVSHIQEALIGACRSEYESSVVVYKCLMAYADENQIKDITGVDLLQYAAGGGGGSGIVSDLLRRYNDSFLVSHIQEALIGACQSIKISSVDVYKCLMAYVDEHQIKDIAGVDLLQYAAEGGGGSGKVSDLLRRYKDSFLVSHIQEALIGACRSGYESSVDIYKCLMAYVDEHQIKDIAGVDLLQYAAEGGGGSGKVSDLLRRYKDSFKVSHIQEALIGACRSKCKFSVDVYKCLMAYVDEHQIKDIAGVDLLQYAAEGCGGSGIVSDLLRRYKDSFKASHIQGALIGACRSGYESSVDVYKCLMAYVDEHQIKDIAGVDLLQHAAESGGSGIVSDLLRRYKDSFLVSHIREALIGACLSGYESSVDVYKCLMAYADEHRIKDIAGVDLLQYAAEGCGGSGIVSDLLRRYKDSFKASHIQGALIGACRSGYESSVDVYKCLMAYVDEHQIKDIAGVDLLQHAAESGGSGIVSDLLRRYKDSFLVSHIQEALIGACRSGYESSVDVYKCLMAYVDEHQIKDIAGVDLLQHAAESGGSGIVSDLLRRYKDSFLVSHIQEALIGACRSELETLVDVYKCLMAYVDENQIKDITGVDLLQYAVQGGGGSGIVSDLLRHYKDSFLVSHIQEALIGACRSGYESSVDVYKCLMAYVDENQIKDITGVDLLQYAVQGGGGSGIVSDLLRRYKDSFLASHIQEALIGACQSGYESSVDVYKCLMAYVNEHQIKVIAGVDLLQYAAEGGGGSGKVSDLLRRYKDSFKASHIQEALIGACRSRYEFSVDIYKCLMAYVDDHQIKGITGVDLLQYAIEGGESGKVSDLLRRYKDSFLISHIQEALIGACRSELETLVDVYKCLMAYVDEHRIKDIACVNLLQYAAEEGGGSGKVSDLLQLYKHLFLASQIQMALISACRSISKSSLDVYKCLMAYADEHRIKDIEGIDLLQYAVEGPSSGIMSDLLQRYKNSFNASQTQMALIGALRSVFLSSVDVYKFLMAYVHEHEIDCNTGIDFLQYAIEGAHSEKVSDWLQRYKDLSDASQIQIELIDTCQSRCKSSVDVYKCLMAYINEHQIKDIAGVELVDAARDINL